MTRLRELVRAIREGDPATVEDAVLRLSRSRRWLAPLALGVGAFAMLFDGLKLVFSNWRLTVVQILPAMWIWLAMLDLKAHALHGKSFHALSGPVVIPLVLTIVAITAAAFFLNAVSHSRSPDLFIPGIFVLALGFTLQAGATGAVKAVKMSARLVAGQSAASGTATAVGPPPDPARNAI